MHWITIFDFIRHLLEFFFFLVTGPLVTTVAINKMTQRKTFREKVFELEEKVKILEQERKVFQIENKIHSTESRADDK